VLIIPVRGLYIPLSQDTHTRTMSHKEIQIGKEFVEMNASRLMNLGAAVLQNALAPRNNENQDVNQQM
jgi:hypothetical protein